jgi:hypothetical protein
MHVAITGYYSIGRKTQGSLSENCNFFYGAISSDEIDNPAHGLEWRLALESKA